MTALFPPHLKRYENDSALSCRTTLFEDVRSLLAASTVRLQPTESISAPTRYWRSSKSSSHANNCNEDVIAELGFDPITRCSTFNIVT